MKLAGDVIKASEAYTKGSIRGRDPGGPVGIKEHGAEKEKRQELGRPLRFLLDQVGLFN